MGEPGARQRKRERPSNSSLRQKPLSPEGTQAKAAIIRECKNLAAAGVTFVAVHFEQYPLIVLEPSCRRRMLRALSAPFVLSAAEINSLLLGLRCFLRLKDVAGLI